MGDWISGKPFAPVIGQRYRVSFGEVTYQGRHGRWEATLLIRADNSSEWIDEDTGEPIDPEIMRNTIQEYKKL